MNAVDMKCVMIIDSQLPIGIVANTSAILGVTLGEQVPHLVGENAADALHETHLGIVTIPITMLKGSKAGLSELRQRLYAPEFSDLVVVDFTEAAQISQVYSDYVRKLEALSTQEHTYLGIGIYGEKKKINKLTGAMPLLRG
ncbi:DUF2000 domain-containing protein [Anaerotignum sp.]|uniref:DUF2000 domain-containing protein n=1 Tax=Anaerotignum sp. TaxID=2039241 RepID=UPI002897964B|nr:DUF2000 domain-containing protein [Anaerotignum sp.]